MSVVEIVKLSGPIHSVEAALGDLVHQHLHDALVAVFALYVGVRQISLTLSLKS